MSKRQKLIRTPDEGIYKDDVVDNLTSTDTDKPLSANQGKQLLDTKVEKSGDTMSGLLRLTAGLNFNESGGDTLSDYEVGTWTPVYAPASGLFDSITYGPRDGLYLKVGKLVFISWLIRTSALSIGSASGVVFIAGLPFAPNDSNSGSIIARLENFNFSNIPTSSRVVAAGLIEISKSLPNTGYNEVQVSDLSTSSSSNQNRWHGSAIYRTS